MTRAWRNWLPVGLVLVFLWYRLIDHLRIEWSVNPQYAYGWAVPLLCAYLVWKRVVVVAPAPAASEFASECGASPGTCSKIQQSSNPTIHRPASTVAVGRIGFFGALLLYLPTRLVQEANPEWRLVSWALALEVIAISLYLLRRVSVFQRFSVSAFPILFFLVAVPWPTLLEGPLIQSLTRANAATTVEMLGWLGVPALQSGNVIETGSGPVGIDEACSGIRSFQASLMLALFFGELYRLTWRRRCALCLAGFGFSFLFNALRTTLLTWIAAHKGTAALAAWHDPAGTAILLACFLCLWLVSLAPKSKVQGPKSKVQAPSSEFQGPKCKVQAPAASLKPLVSFAILAWLAFAELGTEAWYRWHERHLPEPVTWNIQLPADNPTLRPIALPEKTRQFLRCDQAVSAGWEGGGFRWQAIFLRWQPGRTAVHLAKGHTPEVCLTAAGNELTAQSELRVVLCPALSLPCKLYAFKTDKGLLHVLYCLWRDRAPGQVFATSSLTYQNRLAPVLTGTRLTGQRSLEIALWGCADGDEARKAMEGQLQRLIDWEKAEMLK